MLAKLDSPDALTSLTSDDLTLVRRQLAESQVMVRETVDRLRQSQEENEMIMRRRDELESRVTTLEAEYEELLGTSLFCNGHGAPQLFLFTEKTINEDEAGDLDLAQSMTALKVSASDVGRQKYLQAQSLLGEA